MRLMNTSCVIQAQGPQKNTSKSYCSIKLGDQKLVFLNLQKTRRIWWNLARIMSLRFLCWKSAVTLPSVDVRYVASPHIWKKGSPVFSKVAHFHGKSSINAKRDQVAIAEPCSATSFELVKNDELKEYQPQARCTHRGSHETTFCYWLENWATEVRWNSTALGQ